MFVFFPLLTCNSNCFSLNTCPAPLAKQGKKVPVISFSQDKSSGTSIQMITELGKKRLCPVLQCCNCCCLHISFFFWFLFAAQEAQSIPMASLWAHFTLGSGWNCLSCFAPPLISKRNFSLLFFPRITGPLIPLEVLVVVFVASSVRSHSLACSLLSSQLCPYDWHLFLSAQKEQFSN